MARVITVTSGKGGVGKTNISVNLALHLASLGYRTCLFDADLGLANVNILLGLYPEYTLADVILSQKSLNEIIIRNYHGIDIIPGSSGVESMANLESDRIERLIASFSELAGYDFFLLDTTAGVSRNVISFCLASSDVILITTHEPTALIDAYALLKILALNGFGDSAMVVINQSSNLKVARMAYAKLKETVKQYLSIDILPLGTIFHDSNVIEAVKAQQPFILRYPDTDASKCVKNIARYLIQKGSTECEAFGLDTFWTKCLKLFRSPLQTGGGKAEIKQEKSGTDSAPSAGYGAATAATREPGFLAEPAHAPEKMDADHSVKEVIKALNELVENVTNLSGEVGAIRKILEGEREIHPEATADSASKTAGGEFKKIRLDFESFLERQGNSRSEFKS